MLFSQTSVYGIRYIVRYSLYQNWSTKFSIPKNLKSKKSILKCIVFFSFRVPSRTSVFWAFCVFVTLHLICWGFIEPISVFFMTFDIILRGTASMSAIYRFFFTKTLFVRGIAWKHKIHINITNLRVCLYA